MALKYNNSPNVRKIIFNGTNLQPINDWAERTIYNVDCSVSDGVGYLNNTSTAGSWQNISSNSITLPAGTYTLYFWTNWTGTGIGLGLYNSNHQDLYQINTQRYKTFTLTTEETFSIVFWWSTGSMAFNNTYIKSMVKSGTYDADTQFCAIAPNQEVNKVVKDGEVVWVRPFNFNASAINNDNLMDLTFASSTNGVTVTKGQRDGMYTLGGSASSPTWIITQFIFPTTGTYYVRNFDYISTDKVKCYMSSFSDSSYPDDYWLEGSTLTFNITAANTTCNFCLYVAPQYTSQSISQTLKIYISKVHRNIWTSVKPAVAGTDYLTASITQSEEPLVKDSLPYPIRNGDDVYNGDRIRFTYYTGIDRTVTTITIGPTFLNQPSITNSFQGNYGFTAYNPNDYDCTGYWYAEYNDTKAMGPTYRTPTSGYNTFSLDKNSNSSRQTTGLSAGRYINVKVYVYFATTKTTITKTVYTNYNATPTGLTDTSYTDSFIEDTLYERTFNGTVNLSNVSLAIDNYTKTSSASSSSTITSTTSSRSLTY